MNGTASSHQASASLPRPRGWIHHVLAASAAVLGGLSLIVMAGWLAGSNALTRVFLGDTPMAFNTAVAFLMGAVALLGLSLRRPVWATAGGLVAGLLGTGTLIEYLSGVDIGVHEWFLRPPTDPVTGELQRMAPNTALCFAVAGLALILEGRLFESVRRTLSASLLGAIVFLLGAAAVAGYVLGIEAAYGWGGFTRMAVPTAIGFLVLGGSIFLRAATRDRTEYLTDALLPPQGLGAAETPSEVLRYLRNQMAFLASGRQQLRIFSISLVLICLVIGALSWVFYQSFAETQRLVDRSIRTDELVGTILRYDEKLTACARMAVHSAQIRSAETQRWIAEYERYEKALEAAIEEVKRLAPGAYGSRAAAKTEEANLKLVEMEKRAFLLIRERRSEEAHALLDSSEYHEQKNIYADGMTELTQLVNQEVDSSLVIRRNKTILAMVLMFVGLVFVCASWGGMIAMFHGWTRTIEEGGSALLTKSKELAELNVSLDRKVAERSGELKLSEERYRGIVQDQTEYICRYKPDSTLTFVNDAYCDLKGMKRDELIGRRISDMIDDPERKRLFLAHLANLNKLTPSDCVRFGESSDLHSDGKLHWRHWVDRALFDQDGRLLEIQAVGRDVTAQKEAELALKERESTIRLLLESTGEGICGVDREGRCTFINQAGARMLGYNVQEVIGQRTHDLFHHSRPDRSPYPAEQSPTVQVLRKGVPCRVSDEVYWKKDGSPIPVEYSSFPIWDDRGSVTGAVVVFSDITQRRKMEEELRVSRRQQGAILDTIPDLAWFKDRESRYIAVNEPFAKTCHMTPDQIPGKTDFDLYPRDLAELYRRDDFEVVRTGLRKKMEEPYEGADKVRRWIETIKAPVYDDKGQVVGTVGIARDISERRRAEEDLIRLSSAIENAAEAIVITDLNASIQYVNPAFEKVSGYTREEVLGKNPSILKSGKQEPRFYQQMWETLNRGETWTGEFINRKKDGALFNESASIAPVRDRSGKLIGYVAVKKDVTEQLALEGQIRHAQKMEAVGQMAGGIAHDFNNVLASMLGYAKLARDSLPAESETREDLSLVLKAGDRARQLVDQLLAFSRQSPRKEGKSAVDLGQIVREAMKLIRPTVPANVEIKTVLSQGLPKVLADPTQIHQVIVNLSLNAAQAMPRGGVMTISLQEMSITADDQRHFAAQGRQPLDPGGYLVLSVQDTGTGIPKDVLPRIFEPFFTTKRFGGGMGLSVVFGIVKAHHGDIGVYTEENIGTVMKVYLPVASDAARAESAHRRKAVVGGEESILIVDDEDMLGRMLGKTLSRIGYRVTVEKSPTDALERFRAAPQNFDLVVSDQTMPKMTGDRLAEEIHRIRADIPIILCSGFSEILKPERAREIGIFKVVHKPFMDDELEREIRNALDSAAKKP